jgi:hypothetical protein
VPDLHTYDYAIVRVVPRVERGEFLNVGIILSCSASGYLSARIELDEARLLALAPALDLHAIERGLTAIPRICAGGAEAGPIGLLPTRERFHWLVAPRSTVIQTSPVHTGRCVAMEDTMEKLLDTMVRVPPPRLAPGA